MSHPRDFEGLFEGRLPYHCAYQGDGSFQITVVVDGHELKAIYVCLSPGDETSDFDLVAMGMVTGLMVRDHLAAKGMN